MSARNSGPGVTRRSQRLQQRQEVPEQVVEEEAANSAVIEDEEEVNVEEENMEEVNDEEEEAEPQNVEDRDMEVDVNFGGHSKSSVSGRGTPKDLKKPSAQLEPYSPPSGGMDMEDMIKSTILYLLLHCHTHVKRSDIVKHALDRQDKAFKEVIDKTNAALAEIFGIVLVGFEESKGRTGGYRSYMMVSKYTKKATHCTVQFSKEEELRNAVLVIILCLIFSQGHEIDEGEIKKTLERYNVSVGKKEDDLKRYLKKEYVSTLYLKSEESKDTDTVKTTYAWGIRSEKEYPKTHILNILANFSCKPMEDFIPQYNQILEEEMDILEELKAEKAYEESKASAPAVLEVAEGEAEEMEQDENEEEQDEENEEEQDEEHDKEQDEEHDEEQDEANEEEQDEANEEEQDEANEEEQDEANEEEQEENEEQGEEEQEMEAEVGSQNSLGSRAPSSVCSSCHSNVRGSAGFRSGSSCSRSSYTYSSDTD